MATTTPDAGPALLRLMAWLSPAFPTGSFSYSHGLERAVEDGLIEDVGSLSAWLEDLVERGSAWNDAVLFAESWRVAGAGGGLSEVAELAEALAGSAERHRETMLQGAAFAGAVSAWDVGLPAAAYPVAVGAAAARGGVALADALAAFLQAFVTNQLQAAIRLSLFGQSEAAALLAALEPIILDAARRAARSTLDDLGGCAFMAEIAAMRHETQYSRLFRS